MCGFIEEIEEYERQKALLEVENLRKSALLKKAVDEEQGFRFLEGKLIMNGKIPLCNFEMELVKCYVLMDDNMEECQAFDVILTVAHNGQEDEYSFNSVKVSQLRECAIFKQLPFACTEIPFSKFKSFWEIYVNGLIDEFDKTTQLLYRNSGWKQEKGSLFYVDREKIIGKTFIDAHALNGRVLHNLRGVDYYQELEHMLRTTRNSDKMAVLLLYVLASFIYKVLHIAGNPLKFCLVLVGPRGCRKTSLALCFTQLEDKFSPKFNFTATKAGIQSHLHNYADAVLLIDDLAPSVNPTNKRENEAKLETMIRLFGDAGERIVSKAYKMQYDLDDYAVAGGCVITGEYFYTTGVESSIARTVVLEIDKNEVNLEVLQYFQDHPLILEGLLYDFIEFVSYNSNDVINIIKNNQIGAR